MQGTHDVMAVLSVVLCLVSRDSAEISGEKILLAVVLSPYCDIRSGRTVPWAVGSRVSYNIMGLVVESFSFKL